MMVFIATLGVFMIENLSAPVKVPNKVYNNLVQRRGDVVLPYSGKTVTYNEFSNKSMGMVSVQSGADYAYIAENEKNGRKFVIAEEKELSLTDLTHKIEKSIKKIIDPSDNSLLRQDIKTSYWYRKNPKDSVWYSDGLSILKTKKKDKLVITELKGLGFDIKFNPSNMEDCFIKGFPANLSELPLKFRKVFSEILGHLIKMTR